jgi:hypothetical protein
MISEEAHVASECQTIQEALSENRGEVVRLGAAERQHVDACPACAEVAAAERALGFIFREAVPPADPSVVAGVMAALRPVRTWRRVVAFVPVAASLLLAAVGALLVGGVPGSGVISLLPGWSTQGWSALLGGVTDWYAATSTGAAAAAGAINPVLLAAAGVVGLLGLAGVVATARRWRKIAPWRSRG